MPNSKDKPQEKDIKKEFSAGLVVYYRSKEGPKFLVMYHRGSYWNFPKGHIEPGESSLQAAIRETCEEAGLKESDLRVRQSPKLQERYQFKAPKGKIDKTVTLFLAEAKSKDVRVSEEHDGYGWFLYRDAKRLLSKHKESLEVLRRAFNLIQPGSRQASSRQKPSSKRRSRRGRSKHS